MTRNGERPSAETRRGAMHDARTGTVEDGACRQASSRDSRRRSWQGAEESRDKAGIPIQDQTTRMVRNATAATGGWRGWAGNGVRSSCVPVHDLRSHSVGDEGCGWGGTAGVVEFSNACPACRVCGDNIRSIMTRERVRSRSFPDGSTGMRIRGTSRAVGATGRASLRRRPGNCRCASIGGVVRNELRTDPGAPKRKPDGVASRPAFGSSARLNQLRPGISGLGTILSGLRTRRSSFRRLCCFPPTRARHRRCRRFHTAGRQCDPRPEGSSRRSPPSRKRHYRKP